MCSKGEKVAQLFTKAVATTKCFDQNLRKLKVVCCDKGRMVTQFRVGPEHLNQRGTLHGGFIAHLVDAVSTYALTANDSVETRGVSIDLSVRGVLAKVEIRLRGTQFLKLNNIPKETWVETSKKNLFPLHKTADQLINLLYYTAAKEGDDIEVEATTKKLGKKVAFLDVEVRRKDSGQVLASGRHTKYIGV